MGQDVLVAVTQTAKLLLASSVPRVEDNGPAIGVEDERMHFDAERGNVLLLELASQMAFDKLAGVRIVHHLSLSGPHGLINGVLHLQSSCRCRRRQRGRA